ncbi:unnamed protein product [Timema podura]|uniref:Uncharacterized protein n=1 Tax=Timema podura TaxID=61482 RepID=A0ABN7ND70_TIMPD|nr:unnamed protein product [Timema podura]
MEAVTQVVTPWTKTGDAPGRQDAQFGNPCFSAFFMLNLVDKMVRNYVRESSQHKWSKDDMAAAIGAARDR